MKPVQRIEREKWEENRRKYRKVIIRIFNSVDFPSKQARDVLLESYLINLTELMQYAYANNIQPYGFFKQIEQQVREYAAAEWARVAALNANQHG